MYQQHSNSSFDSFWDLLALLTSTYNTRHRELIFPPGRQYIWLRRSLGKDGTKACRRLRKSEQLRPEHPKPRTALREYIQRRGWTLQKIYRDGGIFGTKASRPALDELLRDCRRKAIIDVVVVWKFDPFARSLTTLVAGLEICGAPRRPLPIVGAISR